MADSYNIVSPVANRTDEYPTAQEAGRAYFNADRNQRPYVMLVPAQGTRRVITGTMALGKYATGEDRFVRSLQQLDDPEFLNGYFEALTASVEERLTRVDWSKYPAVRPTFDGHLFDDLEALAQFDEARGAQLWTQYAPAGTPLPGLDDTASHAESLMPKSKIAELAESPPASSKIPVQETPKQQLLSAIGRKDTQLAVALGETNPDAAIAVEALADAREQLKRLRDLVERDAAQQSIRAVFDELREKGLPVDELNADVRRLETEEVAATPEPDTIRLAVPTSGLGDEKRGPRSRGASSVGESDSIAEARGTPSKNAANIASDPLLYKQFFPEKLLDGIFVRNENGEYTRDGEKRVALVDEEVRIRFVDKQMDTFKAAIELVAVKGWGAIEVTGAEKFRSEAWLHASLAGLEVKGYEPNDNDKALLESKKKEFGRMGDVPLVEASLRQAHALAKMDFDEVEEPDIAGGRYTGKIVHETPFHVVQDHGRGKAIVHAKKDIGGEELKKALELEVPLRVEYQKGGVVFSKAKDRNIGKGQER